MEAAANRALADTKPVQIPITVPSVSVDSANSAGRVTLNLPEFKFDTGYGTISVSEMPKVEIALTKSGPGIVAMLLEPDGKRTIVKECYEGSIIFPVEKSYEVILVSENIEHAYATCFGPLLRYSRVLSVMDFIPSNSWTFSPMRFLIFDRLSFVVLSMMESILF